MYQIKMCAALCFSVLISGCATPTTRIASGSVSDVKNEELEQTAFALRTEMERNQKLNDLYWPLRERNSLLCGDQISLTPGFNVGHLDTFERKYREAAERKLGITEELSVVMVTARGPAAKAGLQVGDKLRSINRELLALRVQKKSIPMLHRLLDESAAMTKNQHFKARFICLGNCFARSQYLTYQ